MTGDEVDRAIAFLLESQAALTAKVDANAEAQARLTADVSVLTGDVKALTGVANTTLELASKTAENVGLLIVAQTRTNEQIGRLATMLERHVSSGH